MCLFDALSVIGPLIIGTVPIELYVLWHSWGWPIIEVWRCFRCASDREVLGVRRRVTHHKAPGAAFNRCHDHDVQEVDATDNRSAIGNIGQYIFF